MTFCIFYDIVSENYTEQYFPAVWRKESGYLSFHYHRIFSFGTDVTFPCTDIILKLM